MNKPELKVAEPASTTKENGRERAQRDVSSSSSSGKLCEQEFGEEEELDRLNTTACWRQS